jgi:hypothetical protein
MNNLFGWHILELSFTLLAPFFFTFLLGVQDKS